MPGRLDDVGFKTEAGDILSTRNICKMSPLPLIDTLSVRLFVLETNENVMRQRHLLERNWLILLAQSKANFYFDEQVHVVQAGELLFGFRGEKMRIEPLQDAAYIYIEFDGQRADELLRRFGVRSTNRQFAGFEGMIPLCKESLARADEQTIDLAAESMLLYAFSRLGGTSMPNGNLINRMLEITEDRFTDPDFSITALAAELSYNSKYISHVFKKKMGMTYTQYLRSMRIKYAVSLFDHGLDSIKNVALLSGFFDPLYFSSVFKQVVGVSPTEYKNRE